MNRRTINSIVYRFMMIVCFVMLANNAQSENSLIEVKGVVRDAYTKSPIAAAQISVVDKNTSAVTDESGHFSIKVNSTKQVLIVTAYDYNVFEYSLRGKNDVVIELYSNRFSSFFKPVEGITGQVSSSTANASIVTAGDISKSNVLTVDEAFQTSLGGNVRTVNRSGVNGVGASMFIRGINSINLNAQPLYIVDGVIFENFNDVKSIHNGFFSNPLISIDLNDIESVTVLKDGASIYGSKASNGVVMIKTKRAKSMVTKIALNFFTGKTTMPGKIPMMDGEKFRTYASDLLSSQGIKGNDLSRYDFLSADRTNIRAYNTNHNVTDWYDEVYQLGSTSNYMINANGGDEKALYYFSLGYTTNKGVVKTTDMNRINARFNADINLTQNLTLGVNIGFTRTERKLMDDDASSYVSPSQIALVKSPFLSPFSYSRAGLITPDIARTDSFGVSNPRGLINLSNNTYKNYRFNIGVLPTLKITKELTLSTQYDYSLNKTVENMFIPMYYTPSYYLQDYGTSLNEVRNQVMRNQSNFNETKLTYEKSFNHQHYLKALYGYRYMSNFYEMDYIEEHNTGSNTNTTVTGDFSYLKSLGANNETRSLSNFASVDYDFEHRYFVSLVAALDGSSKFGTETKGGIHLFDRSWGVFPSASVGWIISSEKFMKNIPVINFLKVRGGYGLTGNDGLKDYTTMAYFSSTRFMYRANGLVLSNLENAQTQWETTAKANVGIDLSIFKDRLSLLFDYFNSKTTDLLALKTLQNVSGLSNYWCNGGAMTNKGYELSANLKVLNLKDFKWELGASVGHYKNKVTELPGQAYSTPLYGGEIRTEVGQSIGSFYGYKTNGVFATQAAANSANLKIKNVDGSTTNFGAGDVIFVEKPDAKGDVDGIIDANDKQIIGNANPDFYGTVSTKLSYKRFTLNSIFTYSYGNEIYNYVRSQLESGENYNNQTEAMLRRWTAEGQITDMPKATYGDPMGNSRFSDRWIEDGSYIKLKTITLSYDLPIKSNFIEGLNLWISANNLFTVTKYLGLDPEVSAGSSVYSQGIDAGLTPQTRSYYFGIKVNL